MDSSPPHDVASEAKGRRRGRFTGVRSSVAIALLASSGGVAGAAVAWTLGRTGAEREAALMRDVEHREEAGRVALVALEEAREQVRDTRTQLADSERRAAEHRAVELALFATLRAQTSPTDVTRAPLPASWRMAEGEHVGVVDRAAGRVVTIEGLGIEPGAPLDVAMPLVARALQAAPGEPGPWLVRDATGIWGVTPTIGNGLHVVTRVPLRSISLHTEGLDRARRAVASLVAPETEPLFSGGPLPLFLAAAGLVGLLAGLFAHRRLVGPLRSACDAARAFSHGEMDARADAELGGRDAREVALAINGLLDRADRALEQGRTSETEDIGIAAAAIQRMGEGDLRGPAPSLRAPFVPIGQAIERARKGFLDRVTRLHESAVGIASDAEQIWPSARRIGDAATEQRDALRRIQEGATAAERQVLQSTERLQAGLERILRLAADERKVVHEVRASLLGIGRRVADLGAGAARVEGVIVAADSIQQGLSVLATVRALHGENLDPELLSKTSAAIVDGRAALETIRRELGSLRDDMGTVARTLEELAESQPDGPADVETWATVPLYDVAAVFGRTSELVSSALRALERAARLMGEAAQDVHERSDAVSRQLPRLAASLSEIRVGGSFEQALLERLERARRELDQTEGVTSGMTEDGRAMMAEVEATAEAARTRLAQLVRSTEAAIAVLRS